MSKRTGRLLTLLLVFTLVFPSIALATAEADESAKLDVGRIEGLDRYATANAISAAAYDAADKVILASGGSKNYPDALAGSALAGSLGAPILLTGNKAIDLDTLEVIKGLAPSEVIVLGGEEAISTGILANLKDEGLNTRRIAGKDRYETAEKIAKEIENRSSHAFVALGTSFPDALSIGPVAARNYSPVILTGSEKMLSSTLDALKEMGITSVTIIGGDKAVSTKVEEQVKEVVASIERVAGEDRYETSAKIADKFFDDNDEVLLASGKDFPDALAGSYLGAKRNAPILLVDPKAEPEAAEDYVKDKGISKVTILGGNEAVGDNIKEEMEAIDKPAKLEIESATASEDGKTITIKFKDQEDVYLLELDEALKDGENKVEFTYRGHDYDVNVDYSEPEEEVEETDPEPEPEPDPDPEPEPEEVDKTELQAVFDEYPQLGSFSRENYTFKSTEIYELAYDYAQDALNYDGANQEEVDEALANLIAAKEGLTSLGDYGNEYVELVVEKAKWWVDRKDDYEDFAYWYYLSSSYNNTIQKIEDSDFQSWSLSTLVSELHYYLELILMQEDGNVDGEILELSIAEAKSVLENQTEYTEISERKLQDAVDYAINVQTDEELSVFEAKEAIERLRVARAELERKPDKSR